MHTIKRIGLLLLFSSLLTICCANDAIICDTDNNIQIKDIHHAGSYVVTFTLGNADEYYGEFEINV